MYANPKYVNDPTGTEKIGISVGVDGVVWFVPLDERNTDYQRIMELVAKGKLTIAPADEPVK